MADALYCRLNERGRKQFKPSAGASLGQQHSEYFSVGLPAHKAALEGNVDGLREIFTTCKDEGVPSRDLNGATPLHLAVKSNRVETTKWMLRYTDLSPLATAKHGETPVHIAAVLGNTECLKALLSPEGKQDVKAALSTSTDNSGFTPLHLAIVKYRTDSAKILISELGVRGVGVINESGITAAHVAASSGNVDVLKLLAQKHKKLLSHVAADGTTPVYFAAQEGRLEAFKFLHVKGRCDVACPSNDGLKPIHAACQGGHTNIVKYLVSCMGNSVIFDLTPDGATPLHFAASAGKVKTAHWLINSDVGGKLVLAKDKNGDTPAHDAADNGKTEVLKLLLESGADLYAINTEGNTPYSLALSGQFPEMADYVMSYASKCPQKPSEGPSRMTIYDLQGEVDVVDFGAPVSGKPQAPDEHNQHQPALAEAGKSKGKKKTSTKSPVKTGGKEKKKGKKEKEKEKEKEKNAGRKETTSFLGQSNPTFQSLQTDKSPSKLKTAVATEDDVLEMTDSELALFTDGPKSLIEDEGNDDIVVRYSESANDAGQESSRKLQGSTDYATVHEIARSEERKEKKKMRKTSKSLQNALKPGHQVADSTTEQAENGFGGAEMGFKPSFRSNPLQRMNVMAEKHPPPTPPPTPATGAGSSAPSDEFETPAQLLDTDDDDNPYDVYAKPDREVVKQKALKRQKMKEEERESENKKLLEDALIDLSDEDSPPSVPEQKISSSEGEDEKSTAAPKIGKVWPPPPPPSQDSKQKSSEGRKQDVLKRWPPAASPQHEDIISNKPRMKLASQWVPKTKQEEENSSHDAPEESTPPPPTEPIAPPEVPRAPSPDTKNKLPVKLRTVHAVDKRDTSQDQQPEVELSKIKLKKPSDAARAYFSSPDKEIMSGASNELKAKLMKRKQ